MTALKQIDCLRDRLLQAELLFPTSVTGVYGRSSTYQAVVDAVAQMVHQWAARLGATTVHFPPVVARSTVVASGYLQSFPHLAGSVHVFNGNDRDHVELVRRLERGREWPELLSPSEVMLAPACCHSLYPMLEGPLPEGGRLYETRGFCFRHEPSEDPFRMQAFHMHELVYVGEAETAGHFRDETFDAGMQMLSDLGLELVGAPANDPFFGRLGASLAAGQREEELKIEGLLSLGDRDVAIISGNRHRDHFTIPFEITTSTGVVAHSACVGFGEDRVALALFVRHGFDPGSWPLVVKERLFS